MNDILWRPRVKYSNENIFRHTPGLQLFTILNASQDSENNHQALREQLLTLYRNTDSKLDFYYEFIQGFALVLASPEKSPYADRMLEFIVKVFVFHEEEFQDLLEGIITFLYNNCESKNSSTRAWCCIFVHKLLTNLQDIDDSISRTIIHAMLKLMKDKAQIRALAVPAIHRLQFPNPSGVAQEPPCRVTEAFIFHLERDPSATVRSEIVKYLAVSPATLRYLINRLSDVDSHVRTLTYRCLSKVNIKKVRIAYRHQICKASMNDPSESVRKNAVSRLFMAWYRLCNENLLQFVTLLDVTNLNENVLQFVLFELFTNLPVVTLVDFLVSLQPRGKRIPHDQLTPENASLWYHIMAYIENVVNDNQDTFSKLVPELTPFTKYISLFTPDEEQKSSRDFIITQLLRIAALHSPDDETGSIQLRTYCIDMLSNDKELLTPIPVAVKILERLIPSHEERLQIMAHILSDIQEPDGEDSNQNVEMKNLQAKVDDDESDTSSCEEDEIKSDPPTLIRCLKVLLEFIKSRDIREMNPTLHTINQQVLTRCFSKDNDELLKLAQRARTCFCIMDKECAKKNFIFFLIQFETSKSDPLTPLESIFDMLIVHGLDEFTTNNEYRIESPHRTISRDRTLSPYMQYFFGQIIVPLLTGSSIELKSKVCEGLIKLFLSRQLNAPSVLVHLMAAWTNSDPEIRTRLGMFLHLFSTKRPGGPDLLVEVFIASITHVNVSDVDEFGDDKDLDPNCLAKAFIAALSHDSALPSPSIEEKGSYHFQLATKIVAALEKRSDQSVMILARALNLLKFTMEDRVHASTLLLRVNESLKKRGRVWNKRVLKIVETVKSDLEKLEKSRPDKNILGTSLTENVIPIEPTETTQVDERESRRIEDFPSSDDAPISLCTRKRKLREKPLP